MCSSPLLVAWIMFAGTTNFKVVGGVLLGLQSSGQYGDAETKIIFEGKQVDKEQLWQSCMFTLWTRLKAYQKDFQYSYQQWQVNPGNCLIQL